MLLTDRSGLGAALATVASLFLLRAVAHRVTELLGLVDGRRFELRPYHLANRLDPVGDDVPFLAVPLLDERLPVPLVVLAGPPQRAHHALHPQLFQPLLGDVEVLEAPAHLLAGERLVAVLRHRGP